MHTIQDQLKNAPTIHGRPVMIFSDFDGSITERDAIVMTLERFAPPEWKDITRKILKERTLPVREGIQQLYALLGSDLKDEIIHFVKTEVKLREGFNDFMIWRKAQGIPFWVVSGGLDAFIHPLLEPYAGDYELFANVANFDAPHIQVDMPYLPKTSSPPAPPMAGSVPSPFQKERGQNQEGFDCKVCGSCACCKVKVMELVKDYNPYTIVIGDSVTDFGMAQVADKVFARSALCNELDDLSVDYTPYSTFLNIYSSLKRSL